LADSLFPPSKESVVSRSGKNIKAGSENYINRFVLFCESKTESGIFMNIVGSELALIGDRLDAAFGATQKGSHANVSREEAKRYIIHAYLLLGDILELADQQDKSRDLVPSDGRASLQIESVVEIPAQKDYRSGEAKRLPADDQSSRK
jgi:hypothetical protein